LNLATEVKIPQLKKAKKIYLPEAQTFKADNLEKVDVNWKNYGLIFIFLSFLIQTASEKASQN
jgi:hypothetical protein